MLIKRNNYVQYHQQQNEKSKAKQTKNNRQYSAVAAVEVVEAVADGEVINIIGITFFRLDSKRHDSTHKVLC